MILIYLFFIEGHTSINGGPQQQLQPNKIKHVQSSKTNKWNSYQVTKRRKIGK